MKRLLWIASWATLLAYALVHVAFIIKTAANIPQWDEWTFLTPEGIVNGWSKAFILTPLNEHRIVFAKFLMLVNLNLFGLNFRYQILFNLLLYCTLLAIIWRLIGKKIGGGSSFSALLAFSVFFTTMPYAFHTMSILVHVHVTIFSFVLGCYYLFHTRGISTVLLAGFLLTVGMFNFAAGVAGAIAVAGFYLLWQRRKNAPRSNLYSLLMSSIIILGTSIWLSGYKKNPHHPDYVMPWSTKFIRFFSEMISYGFGFTEPNVLSATVCSITVALALVASLGAFFNGKGNIPDRAFFLALTLGILGMVAAISFGRGEFPLQQAKMSHYAEIVVFFPLLTLALFQSSPRFAKWGNTLVITLLIIGIWNNFGFSWYRIVQGWQKQGRECVKQILAHPEGNPQGMCPTLSPNPIKEELEISKRLGLSFLSEL